MQDVAIELASALRERIAIVGDEESRRDTQTHLRRLQEVSERINQLSANLPRPVDPRLQHYLDRCSYSKALEFLDGQSA
jgi:hypothetical protein